MTYLPSDYLNSEYTYYSNGKYFIVKTNLNCSDEVCDCYDIFPDQDYLVSNVYSCNPSFISIPYSSFSDTLSYRLDIDKIFIIGFIILFGMIFLLKSLCSMLFKGVFK